MQVTSWSKEQREMFSAALRAGTSIELVLSELGQRGRRAQRNLRVDEVAPLVDEIRIADATLQAAADTYRAPSRVEGRTDTVTAIIPSNRKTVMGINALRNQDVDVQVLILSNGECPTHVDGARVIRLPWEGHGATRARALEFVETEYVFFTVDDAIPQGEGCIRTLIDALNTGGWEAAVARQIPWPHSDAVTAARLRRWTPPGKRVVPTLQTDHVATLFRTETLQKYPIPNVPIAEDAWWSLHRRVAYVPMAPVLHSHARNPRALFERNRAIHAQLVAMGHPASVPSIGSLIQALPGVIRPTLAGGPGELMNQLAEITGQWWGATKGV